MIEKTLSTTTRNGQDLEVYSDTDGLEIQHNLHKTNPYEVVGIWLERDEVVALMDALEAGLSRMDAKEISENPLTEISDLLS